MKFLKEERSKAKKHFHGLINLYTTQGGPQRKIENIVHFSFAGLGAIFGIAMGYKVITPAVVTHIQKYDFFKRFSSSTQKILIKTVLPWGCTGLTALLGGLLMQIPSSYLINKFNLKYLKFSEEKAFRIREEAYQLARVSSTRDSIS